MFALSIINMVKLFKLRRRNKRDGVQIFIDICTFCGFEYDDVDSSCSSYWVSRISSVSDYKLIDTILLCYQSVLSMDYQRFFDKYDIDKIYF